jgi:hypothetical protein
MSAHVTHELARHAAQNPTPFDALATQKGYPRLGMSKKIDMSRHEHGSRKSGPGENLIAEG